MEETAWLALFLPLLLSLLGPRFRRSMSVNLCSLLYNIRANCDLNTVLVVLGGGQPADNHVAVVDTVHLGNSESREQLGDETLSGLASIGLV